MDFAEDEPYFEAVGYGIILGADAECYGGTVLEATTQKQEQMAMK